MKYRPDIDGLRAVAVLLVIGFHYGLSGFHAGFVGVDIFFVISGFLITTITIEQAAIGRFSIGSFYARRIKRIFPPLFALYLVIFIVSFFVLLPSEWRDLGREMANSSLFVSNFLYYFDAGYFDEASESKIYLHTWSLSLEEQYYLIWPWLLILAVYLFGQSAGQRRFVLVGWLFVLAVALLLVALSAWLVETDMHAAFFLLPGRAWQFMLGALCALGLRHYMGTREKPLPLLWANLGGFVAIALLGLSLYFIDSNTAFPGLSAVPLCIGVGLLMVSGSTASGNGVFHVLAMPPMVFLGRISYALYLWHWPLYVLAHKVLQRPPGTYETAYLFGLSMGLATLSLYLVENPIRKSKAPAARFIIGGVAASLIFGLLGLAALKRSSWFVASVSAELELDRYIDQKNPLSKACLQQMASEKIKPHNCLFGKRGRDPEQADFILLGDSHANHWTPGLARLAERRNLTGLQLAASSCLPLVGIYQMSKGKMIERCQGYMRQVEEFLAKSPKKQTIILAARWSLYYDQMQFLRPNAAKWFAFDDHDAAHDLLTTRRVIGRGLARTIDKWRRAGHQIILLGQIPEFGRRQVNCVISRLDKQLDPNACGPGKAALLQRLKPVHELLAKIAARQEGVTLILPHKRLCGSGHCKLYLDDIMLYHDDDHLNVQGSIRLIELLADQIRLK